MAVRAWVECRMLVNGEDEEERNKRVCVVRSKMVVSVSAVEKLQ